MERIILQNITKSFNIAGLKNQGFLANLLSGFSSFWKKQKIEALKEVSVKINSGELVGIIGANGNGKSTLLRVIAGIYKADKGEIKINGKVISLINLLVGLKERLTMKENIFLIGSLFGLSQNEIKEKFIDIVNFSGLDNFVNTKVYQFSNGMMQRLIFSIAIHSNPEIFLLDEVFEVGDEDFREKSVDQIKKIVKSGGCVVLVSHDMEMINKYCSRVLWIEKGKIKKEGNPKEVVQKYLENEVYFNN